MTRQADLVFGASSEYRNRLTTELLKKSLNKDTLVLNIEELEAALKEEALQEGIAYKDSRLETYLAEQLDHAYVNFLPVIYVDTAARRSERKELIRKLQSYNYKVTGWWVQPTLEEEANSKVAKQFNKTKPSTEEGFDYLYEVVDLTPQGIVYDISL